jgi:hypothetical protein
MKISVKIVQAVKTQNRAKTYFRAACSKKLSPEPESSCNFVLLIREDDDLPGRHYHFHFLRNSILQLFKI